MVMGLSFNHDLGIYITHSVWINCTKRSGLCVHLTLGCTTAVLLAVCVHSLLEIFHDVAGYN